MNPEIIQVQGQLKGFFVINICIFIVVDQVVGLCDLKIEIGLCRILLDLLEEEGVVALRLNALFIISSYITDMIYNCRYVIVFKFGAVRADIGYLLVYQINIVEIPLVEEPVNSFLGVTFGILGVHIAFSHKLPHAFAGMRLNRFT